MSFELTSRPLTREVRQLPDVAAGIRHTGADKHRKLTAYILIDGEVVEAMGVKIGDMFGLFLGVGADAGKVRLDFNLKKGEKDLTLRPEVRLKPRAMVLSGRIPFPKIMERTPPIKADYKIIAKGIIEIDLPWDLDADDEDDISELERALNEWED